MATYTENYNLTMPQEDDYYNVEDFNENFETIDTLLAEAGAGTEEISEKIGTNTDTDTNTIFGQLNDLRNTFGQGVSLVKSIQHVIYESVINSSTGSVSIKTVDPTRCFVVFERLKDSTDASAGNVTYALKASSISVSHASYNASKLTLGFWIIEFY